MRKKAEKTDEKEMQGVYDYLMAHKDEIIEEAIKTVQERIRKEKEKKAKKKKKEK